MCKETIINQKTLLLKSQRCSTHKQLISPFLSINIGKFNERYKKKRAAKDRPACLSIARHQALLTLIFLCELFFGAILGKVMCKTPFLKTASAFSVFTSSDIGNVRWKDPKERSM